MEIDKEVLASSGLVEKFVKTHFIKDVSNSGEAKCSNVYLVSNCCSTLVIKSAQFHNKGREFKEEEEEKEVMDRRGSFLQNIKHWGINLCDMSEVKELRIDRLGGIVLRLLFKELAKIINLPMGVGENYNIYSIQLTNISIMEEPPHVNQWDPGGSQQRRDMIMVQLCELRTPKGVVDLLYGWLKEFVSKSSRIEKNELVCVEHLVQGSESSRMALGETHHKQWDPGELYSTSYIIGISSFKLWDPGGRLLSVVFGIFTLRTR